MSTGSKRVPPDRSSHCNRPCLIHTGAKLRVTRPAVAGPEIQSDTADGAKRGAHHLETFDNSFGAELGHGPPHCRQPRQVSCIKSPTNPILPLPFCFNVRPLWACPSRASPPVEEAAVSLQKGRVGPFGTGAPVQWGMLPPGVVTPVLVRPVPVGNIVLYKF